MPRAVLDPNVLVSALISPDGPPATLLVELRGGAFEAIVCPLLLDELRGVLVRPKVRRYVEIADVDAFVPGVRAMSTVYADPVGPPTVSDDPDDDYLIALARDARANALVSGDRHLLELRGKLPILSPAEFLTDLARRAGSS